MRTAILCQKVYKIFCKMTVTFKYYHAIIRGFVCTNVLVYARACVSVCM